ncbi:MAG: diaminopimelate epimerase [Pseudomonadota bacterium]|jgi:diaminopimelate epimerase
MHLEFEKWHGCKNDFMVAWIAATDRDLIIPSLQRQAPALCNRRGDGVGADGILVVVTRTARELTPEELVIINADGSLARNCGNGLRCATRSVLRRMELAGTRKADLPPAIEWHVEGRKFWCKVFDPQGLTGVQMDRVKVEAVGKGSALWQQLASAAGESAEILQSSEAIFVVDAGNMHLVVFGKATTPDNWRKFSEAVQKAGGWDGINVHLSWTPDTGEQVDRMPDKLPRFDVESSFVVIPWERGAGLTQACGSGAVAVAAAANDGMPGGDTWTAVQMPGGTLYVQQAGDGWMLVGPAKLVFTGTVEI